MVVIELKRTEDGGHMELQALRYAAMVSTMTFEQVVETYDAYLRRLGRSEDPRAVILDFLGWDEPDEEHFAQEVRIVLASAEERRKTGQSFDPNRFFFADEDLIRDGGRSYALTNQWGANTSEAIDALLQAFPDRGVSCTTVEPES